MTAVAGPGLVAGPASNAFTDFLDRYESDPVLFVREVFGIEPDAWQREVLEAYGDPLCRRISIRSAHGVGKTAVVAWCASHHVLTRFPQKTAVTAPSSPQLFDAFYAEVLHWVRQLPDALRSLVVEKSDRMELKHAPESSFLTCRTSRQDQPEALQGIHAEHVLLIVDEASGVPEQVFEAAAGSMSGHNATTILIGNPVRTTGLFFDTHHRIASEWKRFHISAFDSPRVSDEFVKEMASRYGEDSNVYRVRVLGEFPLVDDDVAIPFELVEAAQQREVSTNPDAPVVWGVDVARFGGDRSALCKRRANRVMEPVRFWRDLDLMKLTGVIKNEFDQCQFADKPAEILVDVIGIGAGVVDRLRELNLPVRGINVSESPALKDRYANLRAELWFLAKEWLHARDCALPDDDHVLARELVSSKYFYASSGKLQIESKADMKKRGIPSPDAADAFCLTFASDMATITLGQSRQAWNAPLKRNIKGVV